MIVEFLDDLEKRQGISVRSRNLRLTAIHSFFRYAAFEAPAHSAQIQRVLAIPSKRLHADFGPVSRTCGSRRLARCAGSEHLVRPA